MKTAIFEVRSEEIFEDPGVASHRPYYPPVTYRFEFRVSREATKQELPTDDMISVYVAHAGTTEIDVTKLWQERLLETVYQLDETGSTPKAMDVVVDYLDDCLNAGDFPACNSFLRSAKPERLSDPVLVAFLGITASAPEDKLSMRQSFFRRAHGVVTGRRGKAGADKLLTKYR